MSDDAGSSHARQRARRQRLESLLAASEEALAGDHVRGLEQAKMARALAELEHSQTQRARALELQGTHEFRLGQNEAALGTLHEALALLSPEDQVRNSSVLNMIAMTYNELGLKEEALDASSRSLEAAKQSQDRLVLAWAYNRVGVAHSAVDERLKAITALELAHELASEVANERAAFSATINLVAELNGLVRDQQTSDSNATREISERAIMLGEDALRVARAARNPHSEALSLLNLADAHALARHDEVAFELLAVALRLAEEHGFRPIALDAQLIRSRLECLRGNVHVGIAGYSALLTDAHEAKDAAILMEVRLRLSRLLKSEGDFAAALEHFEHYHELMRSQNSRSAATRSRVLGHQIELDRAQLEAERASMDAALQRARSHELELEKIALEQRNAVLITRADQDGLTGLWNRRYIERELPRLVVEARAGTGHLSVMFIDVDHFKDLNDRFGHLAGDDVLRILARTLSGLVRTQDIVGRIGGEEFVILLHDMPVKAAVRLGNRLCEAIRQADLEPLTDHRTITVSVGIATLLPARNPDADATHTATELLDHADRALYAAKNNGRDRVEIWQERAGHG